MQICFENMVSSKRLFHDFNIEELNMKALSNDDIKKLLTILAKFGDEVHSLQVNFDVIAEEDVRTILYFFPNIESLSIQPNREMKGIIPRATLEQKAEALIFASLSSITFKSKMLQLNKIFNNIQLTNNFKMLYVNIPEVSNCFELLKNNSSITQLSITSPKFVPSIPIDHLKLINLSIEMPNAKSLISLVEQQLELDYFDLRNYTDFEYDHNDKQSDELDSSIDSESSDDSNPEMDIDLLMAATKMRSLTNFSVCLDEISAKDFVYFSKLSQLKQLNVKSRKLEKVQEFSVVSLPNVTRLLLEFKRMRVPNSDLARLATNFPNVNDLIYEGEYFCDAFICFAGNFNFLEKLTIMRTHDYMEDYKQFVASDGTKIKVTPSLKSLMLNFGFPEERNVHKFMIRVALTAPNVENLSIEIDSMKIVPDNFIYILRNFKKLKNLKLSYSLFPDESMVEFITSMSDVKGYGKKMELKIINILKEYGTHLEYVQLSLSSSHDVQHKLWKQSFSQQFASIKVDDMYVTMKKDVNAKEFELFA